MIYWILGNKFQWNLYQYIKIFIQGCAFENVVCKMAAILSQPKSVKHQTSATVRMALLQIDNGCVRASQIAKFMGPTWGPPGSCRPQMGPMLAPCTLAIRDFFHHFLVSWELASPSTTWTVTHLVLCIEILIPYDINIYHVANYASLQQTRCLAIHLAVLEQTNASSLCCCKV